MAAESREGGAAETVTATGVMSGRGAPAVTGDGGTTAAAATAVEEVDTGAGVTPAKTQPGAPSRRAADAGGASAPTPDVGADIETQTQTGNGALTDGGGGDIIPVDLLTTTHGAAVWHLNVPP